MTRQFYDAVYQPDHPLGYGGVGDGMAIRAAAMRESTSAWLEQTGLAARPEAAVLEIGCGRAYLSDVHPGWCGVEYSQTAVAEIARQRVQTPVFAADAQSLPFVRDSFDGVFTWATLEHVVDPNKAFEEMDRVLKPGGHALLAPAWNCRRWTVKKLEVRPYRDLGMRDRLEKALIPLRELLAVRAVSALPKRMLGELKMLAGRPTPLRYRPLSPRWDLIERLGHTSDDDAVADIDPHAAVCFFQTRGYDVCSHRSALARLLIRHESVMVRKVLS
jgi:SAM-dependent methyltransferase